MAFRRSNFDLSKILALLTGVVVVAALYFGRAVFEPIAMALLLSFLLAWPVKKMEQLKFPRLVAVTLVVGLVMAGAIAMGVVVTNQLVDVTTQLPNYRANIKTKIASLHDPKRVSVVRATAAIEEISKDVGGPTTGMPASERQRGASRPSESKSDKPVQVEVVKSPFDSWESPLIWLGPLGVTGLVLVFTVFILMQHEDLRNRLIRLVGHNHINLLTQAMDDASQRISKYLLLQFIVNASYGVVIGLGLHFIGLPNALLWGVIASVCRFVPYVGPPIAALLPILLSLAVFGGWTRSLMIAGFYIVTEIVVGNFVEPLLYGSNTGISSLAILVSAVFWTLLWGPVGLILSTPLTVCLVVLGRHAPQMEFLHVLLGDEPVLTPEIHFYQRMLASDLTEARHVLEEYLRGKSLQDLYDSVLIPALGMAKRDRYENDVDASAGCSICKNIRELIEELNEEYGNPQDFAPDETQDDPDPQTTHALPSKIICIAARDDVDETVGIMLLQLLERKGELVRCISLDEVAEVVNQLVEDKPDVVIISALQPFALTRARKLYTQIRTRLPMVPIMIGLWNFSGELATISARLGPDVHGMIVTNLAAAIAQLGFLADARRALQDSEITASR